MTPSQAYRAALEAAAKVAEKTWEAEYNAAMYPEGPEEWRRVYGTNSAAAIRALPVPEEAGDMVMVPKMPTTAGWKP